MVNHKICPNRTKLIKFSSKNVFMSSNTWNVFSDCVPLHVITH